MERCRAIPSRRGVAEGRGVLHRQANSRYFVSHRQANSKYFVSHRQANIKHIVSHRQANSKYIVSHRQANAHTFTVVSVAPFRLVFALGVCAAKSGWGLWKQRIKIRSIFFFSLSSDAFLTLCFRMCCFRCALIIRLL